MIDLTGVSKIYPVKGGGQVVALDGVNLHVDRGSILESSAVLVRVSPRSSGV